MDSSWEAMLKPYLLPMVYDAKGRNIFKDFIGLTC
jgi:hypothetical protein